MLNIRYDSSLKNPSLFNTLRALDLYSTTSSTRTRFCTSSEYRVEEKDNELHLSIDLPGVKAKDISVQTTGRDIKITGSLRGDDFKYSYVLSKDFDPDTITATHEDGVLTFTFDKATSSKTRTVEINLK
jgi:HSP20 family molecular chaperone IbpA